MAQGVAIGDIGRKEADELRDSGPPGDGTPTDEEEKTSHLGRAGERRKKRKFRRLPRQVVFVQAE